MIKKPCHGDEEVMVKTRCDGIGDLVAVEVTLLTWPLVCLCRTIEVSKMRARSCVREESRVRRWGTGGVGVCSPNELAQRLSR